MMELIRVPKVDNVKLVDRLNSANPDVGTLYLTPTHVIFVNSKVKKECWILMTHIQSVSMLPTSATGTPIFIRCKNFLHVTFYIPKQNDALDVYLSLNQLSQPAKIDDLYCFYYNSQDESINKADGWSNFSLEAEYSRFMESSKNWVLTDLNSDYALCDTYPSKLYVPSSATNECLQGSARFRSKGRFPVLSYLHHNQAAICRCSQPLAGFNNRSIEDEQLIEKILLSNPNPKKELYVVDTRPKINAMANRAAGKGYESGQNYPGIKFQFFAIENIHVMRTSIGKLSDACEVRTMNHFLSSLESSQWLKHVKSLLEASNFISNSIKDGIPVAVHCSDGWDRTAQACSLASIQLDPYYRTIRGFQALIFQSWLSFGHKFTDRCGLIIEDSKEVAPVFTQFLDAVWQITCQHPTEFEFNENFLIVIHDHVHSSQFGTFVGNSEKERIELRLSERTYSLWAFLDNNRDEYLNPFYKPIPGPVKIGDATEDQTSSPVKANPSYPIRCDDNFLDVDTAPQRVRFWSGLYNRHEVLIHPREPLVNLLLNERKSIKLLRQELVEA